MNKPGAKLTLPVQPIARKLRERGPVRHRSRFPAYRRRWGARSRHTSCPRRAGSRHSAPRLALPSSPTEARCRSPRPCRRRCRGSGSRSPLCSPCRPASRSALGASSSTSRDRRISLGGSFRSRPPDTAETSRGRGPSSQDSRSVVSAASAALTAEDERDGGSGNGHEWVRRHGRFSSAYPHRSGRPPKSFGFG